MSSYRPYKPASARSSKAAHGSSRKRDTQCELLLRKELWRRGRRYRVDARGLAGRPDIVFARWKLAIFCDGDFWHGRDLRRRLEKLRKGHNSAYWVAKIKGNVARDRKNEKLLSQAGWVVLRLWESDIRADASAEADKVDKALERLGVTL